MEARADFALLTLPVLICGMAGKGPENMRDAKCRASHKNFNFFARGQKIKRRSAGLCVGKEFRIVGGEMNCFG